MGMYNFSAQHPLVTSECCIGHLALLVGGWKRITVMTQPVVGGSWEENPRSVKPCRKEGELTLQPGSEGGL